MFVEMNCEGLHLFVHLYAGNKIDMLCTLWVSYGPADIFVSSLHSSV